MTDRERWEEIRNAIVTANQRLPVSYLDEACKRLAAQERELERLRHENRQMLDAAEELSIGQFSRMACFVTQDPRDPTKLAWMEPSRIQGLYEEFRRKIEELGDWSRMREQERELAEARRRIKELEGRNDD